MPSNGRTFKSITAADLAEQSWLRRTIVHIVNLVERIRSRVHSDEKCRVWTTEVQSTVRNLFGVEPSRSAIGHIGSVLNTLLYAYRVLTGQVESALGLEWAQCYAVHRRTIR